jgi:predicted dehydrogenase
MGKKLQVGIVGASGWMAGALARGIEYTDQGEKSPISTVAGLCDLQEEALIKRKEELNLENAELFTSYEKMLSSPRIEAIVVTVPNFLHVSFALQALAAQKHLFLEKPLATSSKDAKKLIAFSEKSSVTTKLDYILVHYDEQVKLKKLVQEGAFGEIASTHFTYRHPIQVGQTAGQEWKLLREKSGGAIPMGICHAISLTVFQVEANPRLVISRSSPPKVRSFNYHTQYDIMVIFENGVVSLIQGNIDFAEKYDARHTIIGTEGQFDYNPLNSLETRVKWSSQKLSRPYSDDPLFARHHLDSGDVWKHQCGSTIQEFIKHCLKGEKDPLLGIESKLVRRTEAIIWAAEESAQKGTQPVKVEDF